VSLVQENRTRGILWMLATMVCFISLDATMKYALEFLPLVEVTWARFFFASLSALIICGRDLPKLWRSAQPGYQLIRSLLLMLTTGLFNAGIMEVPLATATVLMFMSPILVTVMSALVLQEHVGVRRWIGVAVGFLGALVVARAWENGMSMFNTGTLLLFAAAFANASYQITTRKLRGDQPLTTLLFTAATGAIVSTGLLPWHWEMPDGKEWLLMIASGVLGCVGHLCLIRAYRLAPASVIAPFAYSSLIWATLLGFAIWQDVPELTTLIGATMIIGSGLYIFLRERSLAASA
jgi:drug/metabolite transporter (DMT)-like permease